MNSLADALTSRFSEERARGGEPERTDTLIRAALSLSQAIEALGTINFMKGAQPPDVRRGVDFYEEVRHFEVALILEALRITRGSQSRAAVLLGLNKTTLNCMIKRYGIDAEALVVTNEASECQAPRSKESQPTEGHVGNDLARTA